MASFSQRQGYKPIKSIVQFEAIDDELRISLWNAVDSFYWSKVNTVYTLASKHNERVQWLLQDIWSEYFKSPIDTIGSSWTPVNKYLREYYFSCHWNEVYDFIEFIANHYNSNSVNDGFREECNRVLEREVSGYRFIGDTVTQITAEEEIVEVEEALALGDQLRPISIHLKTALDLLSDRKSPDYRNSIKESISAVEAICRLIAGSNATLGKALGAIQRKGNIELHGALKDAFDKLYGYTSDEGGIRHSLLEESELDFEDAKFMLVSCSAFINYLKVKVSKAGIDL